MIGQTISQYKIIDTLGPSGSLRLGFAGLLGVPVLRLDYGYGFRPATWELSGGFE